MKWLHVLSAVVIFSQISSAQADPKYSMYLHTQRIKAAQNGESFSAGAETPAKQMDQLVDHFAKKPKKGDTTPSMFGKTFKQNYYVDKTLVPKDHQTDAPVILYLCGEGPCEGPTGTSVVDTLAQTYGAYRVALEHRYYGSSQPFGDLTSPNMIYLSMDQALEDLASFELMLKKDLKLTGKWIVVGGSYAGELAAYYRLKHPELVEGALASSGPVLAKADFLEYDKHIAEVVSPACLAAIKGVVADVEGKLQDATSTAQVKALFDASAVVDNVDFLYVIADMAAMAVQYGHQTDFCATLANPGSLTVTEAYAKFGIAIFNDLFQLTPLLDSFQGAMDTSISSGAAVGMRGWMYQSCTEFGYYQIANPDAAQSARSQEITLPYHNEACDRLFSIKTQVDTAATNANYFNHLADKTTTNIFFTNGSEDPWSTLSLTDTSGTAQANPALSFFMIDGASHCSDLGHDMTQALTQARNEFMSLAKGWLATTP